MKGGKLSKLRWRLLLMMREERQFGLMDSLQHYLHRSLTMLMVCSNRAGD